MVFGALLVPTVWPVNVKAPGETVGATPSPVRGMDCGEFAALSVTTSDALRGPVAVGSKNKEKVQELLAPRVEPQVVVSVKSPRLAPAIVWLVMLRVEAPVLVRVTDFAELFTANASEPK